MSFENGRTRGYVFSRRLIPLTGISNGKRPVIDRASCSTVSEATSDAGIQQLTDDDQFCLCGKSAAVPCINAKQQSVQRSHCVVVVSR